MIDLQPQSQGVGLFSQVFESQAHYLGEDIFFFQAIEGCFGLVKFAALVQGCQGLFFLQAHHGLEEVVVQPEQLIQLT